MADPPSAEVDRLYALPLDEFTGERDELAKRLRKDGDREAATEVKALRKPSVPAWAVNQVRRDRPDDVRRLLEVTEELHRVYAGLSSAGARERLAEASAMQRELIGSLVRCASELLRHGGHAATDATLSKVADTLRAAALDEELRGQIAAGRVMKERRAAGLGPLESLPPGTAPARRQRPKDGKKGRSKASDERTRSDAGEEALPAPDSKELRAAERSVASAGERADKARVEVEKAERRLREKAEAADRARAQLAEAQVRLRELRESL